MKFRSKKDLKLQAKVFLSVILLSLVSCSQVLLGNNGNSLSSEYQNNDVGFLVKYPGEWLLSQDPNGKGADLVYPAAPGTNVVDERVTITFQTNTQCRSPLEEGRDPLLLDGRVVNLDGNTFLRQSFTGVAAGTSYIQVSYSGLVNDYCLIFLFELATYDPANLDPTVFPNLPRSVDSQSEVERFDAIMSTFRTLN